MLVEWLFVLLEPEPLSVPPVGFALESVEESVMGTGALAPLSSLNVLWEVVREEEERVVVNQALSVWPL